MLLLTPFTQHDSADAAFDRESVEFVERLTAKTEPSEEYYAPYTARAAWRVLRTIDWTHVLHAGARSGVERLRSRSAASAHAAWCSRSAAVWASAMSRLTSD